MENQEYKIISVNRQNIDCEHICCAIGDDKENRDRAKVKKEWLKTQFDSGHTFKKVNVRGKVFIEYAPAETAWFPVVADNYTLIQCLWVSGKFQGQGISPMLMAECEKDSANKNGIMAITTTKKQPFLVEKKYYLSQGFEVCDAAYPNFELVVKKFRKDAPNPCFTDKARAGKIENTNGLVFYYSDLCPFISGHLENMIDVAHQRQIPCDAVKIENLQQAKELPSVFPILSVFLNGTFLTYELMIPKKFNALLDKQLMK